MSLRSVVQLACTLALLSASAFAQEFRATLTGRILDPSNAAVPNVTVQAKNIATNEVLSAVADSEGNYTVPSLRPGTYNVSVEAPGFKKFTREGLVLNIGQVARVDITLEVGAITEQVTVTAETPLLEASTSSVGKVVDNRRILNLPLNTRNVYSLIFLTPGAAGSVGNNYNNVSYSINGARATMMDTIIDGVTSNHPTVNGFTGMSVFPSVDAIDEFKVEAQNFSAEFGRSLGSVLNVVYKSGTNQMRGSVYEFLRNSVLDSNDFFANRLGRQLASFKRSQFGGMLSGPIKRDKTFFMVSYEGLRQRSPSSTTTTVPTELERRGDFTQTLAANGQLIRIFDPFTTRANPAGAGFIRDAFPGNLVPAVRFDRVAVNVMKYYPAPNALGQPITNQNNYYQTGARTLNTDNYDFRVDHNFSARQRFFARYSHRHVQDNPPVLFPQELAIAEGRITEENRARNAVADYTHTISPTTILTARLGFARTLYVYANQGLGFLPSSLGLPKTIDAVVDRQMFPAFGASGYVGLGGNDHRWNAFNTYSLTSSVSKIYRSHSPKIGYEGRLMRVPNWEARNAGRFDFAAGFTQGPDPTRASATAGNSIASLLLGTGSPPAGESNVLIRNWKNAATQSFYHAWYFQDDWRVVRKLTLNLGLRYDIDFPRTERYNRMNWFDPVARSPLAGKVQGYPDLRGGVRFVGVDGNPRTQFNKDLNNLAPRIGLAYQLDDKTVIRAGYGHFFGPSRQAAAGTVGPFGFRVEYPWVTTVDGGLTPFNTLSNPYPEGFRDAPGSSDGLLTQAGANLQAFLQNSPSPWSMSWNFTIQRELPGGILLETAYVGNRGLYLQRSSESGMNINQLDPKYMALGSQLNQLVDNPFFGIVNNGVHLSSKISRAQMLCPYPQFTTVVPLHDAGSNSIYHAWQNTLKRRFSGGLQVEGSYTWARLLDTGASHQNTYDVAASRALGDRDIAHRFVVSYIYEMPFGRGRRFGSNASKAVNWFLGGWQFNGITMLQTGTPLAMSASNTAGIFNPKTRPNNNGKSGKLSGPVHERLARYFDTSVFSQPTPFTFGNLGETLPDIRNDGVRNFDLSLFKEFAATEQLRVQFRAEFLNAFNTPRFGSPNTSVVSSAFGVISSQANAPRQVQFGLKFLW
jgi:hypothetical protein